MMPSVSRKWLAIVGLALISLTSCSGDASSPSESVPPDPLGLELGDGTYDLEGDVDNSDSSLHYEIFVRTYCDSDGDGVGDFAGVASKAGYLQSLGVGAVWLMPINPSNSYHGYDVNDYYSVNPDYGTMADFESMVETLNEHGIDVVIDMVLNHSGLSNPWFSESYKDRQADDGSADSKADWYVWSDESGLNYHSYADAYYLGAFSPSMPEFNWDCAAFRDEVKKILGFWIGKGVSGFRLDATRYYYEFNMEKNVGALDYITDSARSFDPGCYIVGENWTSGSDYYGYYDSKIDSFFDFETSFGTTNGTTIVSAAAGVTTADQFTAKIESAQKEVKNRNPDGYNSFFVSNHDMDRPSDYLYGNFAKLGASLTYLLPGTPYIYYGEEIMMVGTRGDENTDALRRLPMVWGSGHEDEECDFPEKGMSYLMMHVEQVDDGVYDLLDDPMSLVNHYRKVGEVRNSIPFIRDAVFTAIPTGIRKMFAYELTGKGEGEKVIVVTSGEKVSTAVDLSDHGVTGIVNEIRSSNRKAKLEDGVLSIAPYSTAVLSVA